MFPLPYRLFQRADELLQTQPECLAKHPQLHHVNPPLPAFALGHKRLSFAEPLGELYLRRASQLARSFQGLEEN
jgi:hypothetical protein